MGFFNYASVAGMFTSTLWVQMLTGGLCFALVFAFQAIALFTIASREGYKNKWMAFIPFFNTYYIGVCAQKNRFYNLDTKKVAISAAVFEAALFALNVFWYIVRYGVMEAGGYITYVPEENLGVTIYTPYIQPFVPENLNWAVWVCEHFNDYITWYIDIVFVLLNAVLLVCFFQTYACRRYVLFTVTSIFFPIQGILFFVVRNNRGVNYREFLAARQAQQYRMYQQQQQYYNQNPYNRNPYNSGNPYNQNPYSNQTNPASQTKTDDPFGDFGSNSDNGGNQSPSGSPFDEFDS